MTLPGRTLKSRLIASAGLWFIGTAVRLRLTPQARPRRNVVHIVSLVLLVLGWVVYDGLCKSPLGDNDAALGAVVFAFIVAAALASKRVNRNAASISAPPAPPLQALECAAQTR